MTEIKVAETNKDVKACMEIRHEVFVIGQDVPDDREIDGLDNESKHVLAMKDGKPIGCGRIRYIDGHAKLERIAVLDECRKHGIGKKIVLFMIEYCKEKKVDEIIIHSQCYVQGFYEKLGFKPRGNIFMDADIEHIEMFL